MKPKRCAPRNFATMIACRRRSSRCRALLHSAAALIALAAVVCSSDIAAADEGGVSFWLPGLFGSLAATPQQPGWAAASIYYHTAVSASGDVSRSREFEIRNIPVNLTARVNANLNATGDLGIFAPSYVFATPVFGGQAAATLLAIYGNTSTSLAGTVTGTIGPIPFGPRFDSLSSSTTGFGDLAPQFAVRWNKGVDNYIAYITGDIPVGDYNSSSLSNIGIGHGAIDAGVGYTYFNPQTGHELSAVLGFTYNLTNPATQYQNGVDMHLDWGVSQFLTQQVQVGLVGYLYDQLSCDSGSGDRVGCFESRVAGIGPQLGLIFPVGAMQGYLNFKTYAEFDAAGSAVRLEYLGYVRDLTSRANSATAVAACDRQIASAVQKIIIRRRSFGSLAAAPIFKTVSGRSHGRGCTPRRLPTAVAAMGQKRTYALQQSRGVSE